MGTSSEEALAKTNEQYLGLLEGVKGLEQIRWLAVNGELPTPECADQLRQAIAQTSRDRAAA